MKPRPQIVAGVAPQQRKSNQPVNQSTRTNMFCLRTAHQPQQHSTENHNLQDRSVRVRTASSEQAQKQNQRCCVRNQVIPATVKKRHCDDTNKTFDSTRLQTEAIEATRKNKIK